MTSKRKGRCGRKPAPRDLSLIPTVPFSRWTTFRKLASALEVSTTTLHKNNQIEKDQAHLKCREASIERGKYVV